MPVSTVRLRNRIYIGNIFPKLCFKYSFSILSLAEHLLFFNNFKHLRISDSVIEKLRMSSSSLVSMLIKFSSSSCVSVF